MVEGTDHLVWNNIIVYTGYKHPFKNIHINLIEQIMQLHFFASRQKS